MLNWKAFFTKNIAKTENTTDIGHAHNSSSSSAVRQETYEAEEKYKTAITMTQGPNCTIALVEEKIAEFGSSRTIPK